MNLLSISDLYDLCLKYADVESIISLKHTCKDFYQKIPESWCIDKIVINEKQDYKKDYRFLSQIYSLHSKIERIHLNYRFFRSLREISLVQVNALSEIRFDPKTNLVRDIFINHAKSLNTIDIPKEYTKLRLLYIAYTNISKLNISNTWSCLKNIVLIGVFQLSELIIPKECENIEFINISKSFVENIYLYPEFKQNLVIRATIVPSILIYTYTSNFVHIIKTGSLILKALK
jgi:hypothetical protein